MEDELKCFNCWNLEVIWSSQVTFSLLGPASCSIWPEIRSRETSITATFNIAIIIYANISKILRIIKEIITVHLDAIVPERKFVSSHTSTEKIFFTNVDSRTIDSISRFIKGCIVYFICLLEFKCVNLWTIQDITRKSIVKMTIILIFPFQNGTLEILELN